MLEVSFKSNLTSQNRLIRSKLHPLIYYELILSLVNVEHPTIFVSPENFITTTFRNAIIQNI